MNRHLDLPSLLSPVYLRIHSTRQLIRKVNDSSFISIKSKQFGGAATTTRFVNLFLSESFIRFWFFQKNKIVNRKNVLLVNFIYG